MLKTKLALVRISPGAVAAISLALAVLAVTGGQGLAGPLQSDWVVGHKSKVRLIAGARPEEAGIAMYAAIEIRMDRKWKTYWRHPGNAGGIAPQFDFSGSSNLGGVEVMFPVPDRLVDDTGTTFGYLEHAVFPVRIVPRDPSRPVDVRLNAFFGVCKEICIPVEAALALEMTPRRVNLFPASLARALDAVPNASRPDQPGDAAVRVVALDIEDTTGQPSLIVRVAGDPKLDVFAEGLGGVMVGVTERLKGESGDGHIAFRVPIAHDALSEVSGRMLRLTIASARGSIERVFRIP